MVKYRDVHKGVKRGPYILETLVSVQETREENWKLEKKAQKFLGKIGETTLYPTFCGQDIIGNAQDICASSYHIAGVSVTMKRFDYEIRPLETSNRPDHYIKFNLVANERLGHVKKMIQKTFPSFNKINRYNNL